MKTLDEIDASIAAVSNAVAQVENRIDLSTVPGNTTYHHVISEPGSYYLSANLEVTKNSGVLIDAAGVTLDLSGYQIVKSSMSGYGILIAALKDRACICNGSLVGFSSAIHYSSSPAAPKGCSFSNLSITESGSYGIAAGDLSSIRNCRINRVGGSGIYTGEGSLVEDCNVADASGAYGIYSKQGSLVHECSVLNHHGSTGIYANYASSIIGCSVNNGEGSYGIRAGGCCLVQHCVVGGMNYTTAESCAIYCTTGSLVDECVVRYNISTNGASLSGVGIYAIGPATVRNCHVLMNSGDGILVGANSYVVGNMCQDNGYSSGDGAGIHVQYSGNRIDSNSLIGNDRGIEADASGSIIVRNTASGNTTDYDIAAGNDLGTLQTSPVGAGAWDNFRF